MFDCNFVIFPVYYLSTLSHTHSTETGIKFLAVAIALILCRIKRRAGFPLFHIFTFPARTTNKLIEFLLLIEIKLFQLHLL